MNFPSGVAAPPSEVDWRRLGERIEQAKALLGTDPLFALAQLVQAEEDANALLDRVMEHAVREARRTGKTWAEIAVATGVKDRQAAWRRWTDRGIR
ncbi:MAG TPA: hypothetical protein VJY33_17655 [Isosphaeraceae bacterium]|nr:hypothetical protein [Isosphaeraceae bacterium]